MPNRSRSRAAAADMRWVSIAEFHSSVKPIYLISQPDKFITMSHLIHASRTIGYVVKYLPFCLYFA